MAVVLRLPFPRGIAARSAFVYGALNFGAAFGLAYYALVELHAGFGQVLLATVPLVTLLVAVAERQERLSIAAAVGWGLVLGGILVIAGVYVGAIRVEAATPAPPEVPPAASALTTRAPRATLAG